MLKCPEKSRLNAYYYALCKPLLRILRAKMENLAG